VWVHDANASLNKLLKALFIIEGRELLDCVGRGLNPKRQARRQQKTVTIKKTRNAI
jgi:hypothetical protein